MDSACGLNKPLLLKELVVRCASGEQCIFHGNEGKRKLMEQGKPRRINLQD